PDAAQVVALAQAVRRRRALAAPVERHDGGALERRGVEGAGGVGGVVVDEVPAVGTIRRDAAEPGGQTVRRAAGQVARRVDDRGQEERVPGRGPFLWRGLGARLQGQLDGRRPGVAAEQLVRIERVGYVVDVGQAGAGRAQTVVDCQEGQFPGRERNGALAVLNVREALLLGRG